ncbi:MAG: DUF4381 family protein [Pseudomonadota bacterium]
MTPTLPLRDVHPGIPPPWWPPAPGWWLVLATIMLVIGFLAWCAARRRRRREAILGLFDDAVEVAGTPAQQVAAMSELLRRAARRAHPGADTLEADDWLRVLDDGLPQPVFSAGAGALLRDGGYRADVSTQQADALRVVARERYLLWMLPK